MARTKEEIDQEYSRTAMLYGDRMRQFVDLQKDVDGLYKRMNELIAEAKTLPPTIAPAKEATDGTSAVL